MVTSIKIILGIIFAVALVAAMWRLIYDWLLKMIPFIFWGIIGAFVFYYAFKLSWELSPPPDAKTKAMYDSIIKQYNGKDYSSRAGSSGQPQDSHQR